MFTPNVTSKAKSFQESSSRLLIQLIFEVLANLSICKDSYDSEHQIGESLAYPNMFCFFSAYILHVSMDTKGQYCCFIL